MSILSDLEAALDAALASEQTKGKVWDDFRDLCDTDTIAALVAVAEAADDVCWIFEDANTTDIQRFRLTCLADTLAPLVKEATDD